MPRSKSSDKSTGADKSRPVFAVMYSESSGEIIICPFNPKTKEIEYGEHFFGEEAERKMEDYAVEFFSMPVRLLINVEPAVDAIGVQYQGKTDEVILA